MIHAQSRLPRLADPCGAVYIESDIDWGERASCGCKAKLANPRFRATLLQRWQRPPTKAIAAKRETDTTAEKAAKAQLAVRTSNHKFLQRRWQAVPEVVLGCERPPTNGA